MLPCQYIGQTSHTLRERFGKHRQGIENNTDESVPIHHHHHHHHNLFNTLRVYTLKNFKLKSARNPKYS